MSFVFKTLVFLQFFLIKSHIVYATSLAEQQTQLKGSNMETIALGNSISLVYIFYLLAIFVFVVFLAYFAVRFFGSRMSTNSLNNHYKIISVLPLAPNRSLYIVRIFNNYILLGVTDHQISFLKEFKSLEEINEIDGLITASGQNKPLFTEQMMSLQILKDFLPSKKSK